MDNITSQPAHLRLAIAPGVSSSQLSALLALQRAEEPEVSITFFEVAGDELLDGLREGRYDVGMSLQGASDPALETQPLWIEHMAVAIPLRLPLLEQASLTIADLQNYPIFRWEAETCSSLDRRLLARLPADPQNLQYVTSFEMMALWVSPATVSGYPHNRVSSTPLDGESACDHWTTAPTKSWRTCIGPRGKRTLFPNGSSAGHCRSQKRSLPDRSGCR